MALQIENITKSYGVDIILENISLTASDNEKIGLIGANGAGKSTLLKIIAGDLSYDSGKIFTPKDAVIGFLRQDSVLEENKSISEYMLTAFEDVLNLEQELRVLEDKMSDYSNEAEHERIMKSYGEKSEIFEKRGGFEVKTRVNMILNGMGFESFDKNMKIRNLSGGEKTKLAMARLLLENPDVLLLDEPTNHLDFKTMQWLESYLKNYKGIVIVVSHDRYFLDFLADTIYEIERSRATRYSGNYTKYLEQKKQNEQIQLKHYNAQQDEIKRLEEYVARNGVRASTAKSAKSKQKAIDRMTLEEKPLMLNEACRFKFDSVFRSYNDVLTVENLSLKVPKNGILESIATNITFDVKRGEKVAVIGANGAGKSTLLKTILGEHRYFEGNAETGRNLKISFYDQEQKHLSEDKTIFDEISDRFPLMDECEIRTHLGSVLFRDEEVFKIIKDLSGGEKARLMLLIIMLEKPNFLILDEPTNHLDLPAKEALDSAISEYDGTVLFVSHDRYFLNKTADFVLELNQNGITRYKGNYDSYIETKNSPNVNSVSEKQKDTSSANDYETQKRLQADIRNTKKKIENSELKIAELEERIESIDESLAECGADFEKARELYEEKQRIEEEMNSMYELWEELHNKLENIK